MDPHVAIVGRPNVGKSRLFNRLVGKRLSIVHDQPGVTRDVISARVDRHFTLMDTGGIGLDQEQAPIREAVEEAVDFAIAAADLILFVVDAYEGPTFLDEQIAADLRKSDKPIILVINKLDRPEQVYQADLFSRLGLTPWIGISAEQGTGIPQLISAIEAVIGPPKAEEESEAVAVHGEQQDPLAISFVGRPNVGKSSLVNALTQSKQLIVTDIAGTTRDSVQLRLDKQIKTGEQVSFLLVDTAGLRPKTKVDSSVEYFSTVRTRQAIEQSHVVFVVLDALEGVTKHEERLIGEVLEAGRGLIIVVNKWDYALQKFNQEPLEGYADVDAFKHAFEEKIRETLFFIPDCPILFTSAKEGYRLERLLTEAYELSRRLARKLPTGALNRLIQDRLQKRRPPAAKGKRFKIFYGVHTGNYPYRIRIYCNQAALLDDSYRRYLQSACVEDFKLKGCPVHFEIIGKTPRYAQKKP